MFTKLGNITFMVTELLALQGRYYEIIIVKQLFRSIQRPHSVLTEWRLLYYNTLNCGLLCSFMLAE